MCLLVSSCVFLCLIVSCCVLLLLLVLTCVVLCFLVFSCVFLCLLVYSCVFLCFLVFSCVFLFLLVSSCVFLCFLVYSCVFLCFLVSSCVFLCRIVSSCVFLCLFVSFLCSLDTRRHHSDSQVPDILHPRRLPLRAERRRCLGLQGGRRLRECSSCPFSPSSVDPALPQLFSSDYTFKPCLLSMEDGFTSSFLMSVETQHTIG